MGELWDPATSAPSSWLRAAVPERHLATVDGAVETARHLAWRSVRQRFEKACKESDVPKAALERWQFTHLLAHPGRDPLLPDHARSETELTDELVAIGWTADRAQTLSEELAKLSTKGILAVSRTRPAGGGKALKWTWEGTSSGAGAITPPKGANALQLARGKISLRLNVEHFTKLKALYDRGPGKSEPRRFMERLFSLLLRYDSLQGGGFQAAVHGEAFDYFRDALGVRMECFASPLNCRYAPVCSAFWDTDAWFGSIGSFLEFSPMEGSYEANPPFVPSMMKAMQRHIESLLARSPRPLSFCVVIPAWETTDGWTRLQRSPFLQHSSTLSQRQHGYFEGSQHWRKTRYRISTCDTTVFVLQNAAGASRWPIPPSFDARLTESFAPKHETIAEKKMKKRMEGGAPRGRGRGGETNSVRKKRERSPVGRDTVDQRDAKKPRRGSSSRGRGGRHVDKMS